MPGAGCLQADEWGGAVLGRSASLVDRVMAPRVRRGRGPSGAAVNGRGRTERATSGETARGGAALSAGRARARGSPRQGTGGLITAARRVAKLW